MAKKAEAGTFQYVLKEKASISMTDIAKRPRGRPKRQNNTNADAKKPILKWLSYE
jgi:hypothetical protein